MNVDQVVEKVYRGLLSQGESFLGVLRRLLGSMLSHEQRNVLYSVLRILPKQDLPLSRSSGDGTLWQGDAREIGGATSLLAGIVCDNHEKQSLKDELVAWLTGTAGGGIGEDVNIRRVVVVSLKDDYGKLLSSYPTVQMTLTKMKIGCSVFWTRPCANLGTSSISSMLQSCIKRV